MAATIRFAHRDDAAGVLAIYTPYCESSTISFEVVAPTVELMADRIEGVSVRYPWLVCEIDGQFAGYAYASQHRGRAAYRWAVDVAVYVATAHHRRGVGRALYTSLFSILREQGYFTAHAGIALPNSSSVSLHEAAGFKLIGLFPKVGYKLGQWLDVGWWQFVLQPEILDPLEPRAIGEVRASAAVAAALVDGAKLIGPTVAA